MDSVSTSQEEAPLKKVSGEKENDSRLLKTQMEDVLKNKRIQIV